MTAPTSSAAAATNRRSVLYWGTTLVLAVECVVGGMMGALRLEPFIGVIRHLGYPAYFMTILGVWYVLAGVALLAPRLPRLKEWAYAGLIFNYTGAAASRFIVGDGAETLIAPIIFTGLSAASWSLRPPTRRDLAAHRAVFDTAAASRSGMIAYWVTTTLVATELALGGVLDILRIPYVLAIIEHLGYPSYFLVIMGVWKVLGAVALLVPRFPRLKEWAYAGAVFTYTGAVASHIAVGDGAGTLVAPIIFAGLTAASWALRPPARGYLASS
jgi:uncharacterized membrane protein YphA (DoxX/SURF4 family)